MCVCAHACVWFSLSMVAAIAQLMSLGSACLTVLASHVATRVWPLVGAACVLRFPGGLRSLGGCNGRNKSLSASLSPRLSPPG